MSENTITIDLTTETQAGLKAVLPFASTDDITPVLVAVQITDRRFLATDRYTVGAFTFNREAEGEETPAWVIPLELATWITQHKIDGAQRVIITDESATIVWHDDSIAASKKVHSIASLNVPPVGRLIHERSTDAVDLPPFGIVTARFKQLVKAEAAMVKIMGRGVPWRFQMAATTNGKAAPIRASLGDDRLVVLIQPNLLLDN